MLRQILIAAVIGVLLGHAPAFSQGADQGAGAPPSDILPLEGIATLVNDEPISYFDVRQRAAMLMVTLGAEPSNEVLQQLAGTALEQLVDERLQLQLAAEFELEIQDNEIQSSINRIAQQAGTDIDTLIAQFRGAGISMRTLEEQVRADIAWRRIMSGRFGQRIRIPRNRIEAQMQRLRSSAQETAYQLAEIFLFTATDEDKIQAQAAADSLIQQLRNGTPFRAAAQQFSSAPTASTGGDMGWVALDDLAPELAAAVEAATQPGILEPITAENGIYILALRGKREPQEATSTLELKQLVATDNNVETLEATMDDVEGCNSIEDVADATDDVLVAELGTIKLTELGIEAQNLVKNLQAGENSTPFQIARGWASIYVCDRKDGIESLPTDEQLENQLYGQELAMISERELRNARLEATILRER